MNSDKTFEHSTIFHRDFNHELNTAVKPDDSHRSQDLTLDTDSPDNLQIQPKEFNMMDGDSLLGIFYLVNQVHAPTVKSMQEIDNQYQEDNSGPSLHLGHPQVNHSNELLNDKIELKEEIAGFSSQSIYSQSNCVIANALQFMIDTSVSSSPNQGQYPLINEYRTFVLLCFKKWIQDYFVEDIFPEVTLEIMSREDTEVAAKALFLNHINLYSDLVLTFKSQCINEIFSNPILYEAYLYFVRALFTGKSCAQLCSFFNFSCCRTEVHTCECMNKWENVAQFTAYDLITGDSISLNN